MKITVYTISDCQFSKQEKDYLKAHNLPYEEKNLESNKEFLAEMLAVSNNFAGTPVTKIEKDDGQIVVLKGFTEPELATALGLTPNLAAPTTTTDATIPVPTSGAETSDAIKTAQTEPPPPPTPQPPTPPTPAPPTSPEPLPKTPANEIPVPAEPTIPPVAPVMPEPTVPPAPPAPGQQAAAPSNDALNSILNDLQAKSADPAPTTSSTAPTATNLPNIPDFSATT